MPEAQVDTTIGSIVQGRYTVEEVIGRGGMATVYRAADATLGRAVAMKIFRADATDADGMRRQRSEVELLASLNHHALVTLYDAGVADEEPPRGFLVMELVEGRDLRERIEKGPVPLPIAGAIGADLAEALHHIHRADVIHRDVKPANILMVPSDIPGAHPHAKLTDFGIAMITDRTRLTADGSVLGTANYLSPEQALGHDLTPASDVYSLGLVLLECVTGQPGFPGSGIETASARIHRPPAISGNLPAGWSSLLMSMTAREPADRPSSVDVAGALHELAAADATGSRHADTSRAEVDGQSANTLLLPVAGSAQTPPATTLDTTELDATVPETTVPETTVPEGTVPEATVPETTTHAMQRGPVGRGHHLRPIVWIVAAAILVVAAAVVVFLVLNSTTGPPAPDYPSVGGQLGVHLRQLQESVKP